jgi:hypothetical protein
VIHHGVILEGRPYGKEQARTSNSECELSLASSGGEGARYNA